MTKQQKK